MTSTTILNRRWAQNTIDSEKLTAEHKITRYGYSIIRTAESRIKQAKFWKILEILEIWYRIVSFLYINLIEEETDEKKANRTCLSELYFRGGPDKSITTRPPLQRL